MEVNKVQLANGEVLIDLTSDSVTPETLAEGATAHDAAGEAISGTMPTTSVLYTEQTLTEAQKAQARENIGAASKTGLTLGIHTDGLLYLFADGVAVGNGIELSAGGDIVGNVDSSNTIILTGLLADGNYTVKYEMENGTLLNIGSLTVDTNVYYSITNSLTQCKTSNSTTKVTEGSSYSATITANSGYKLSSLKVTMGGTDISSSAVSNGKITIASVTGNVVITAVAVEDKPAYTNLAVNIETGVRLNSSGGTSSDDATSAVCTDYIDFSKGDVIRIKGLGPCNVKKSTVYSGGSAHTVQSNASLSTQTAYGTYSYDSSTGIVTFTITYSVTGMSLRVGGTLTGTVADVIITKNEPIV